MILDAQLSFTGTSGQSLSGATTTTSTDYVDLSANIRVLSGRLVTYVSAVGGTTPTLDIELFGDTQTSFATEKSVGKRSIAAADLVANKVYHLDVPPAGAFRYYRVKFTQAGTSPTATVATWLVDEDLNQTDVLLAGVSTP